MPNSQIWGLGCVRECPLLAKSGHSIASPLTSELSADCNAAPLNFIPLRARAGC